MYTTFNSPVIGRDKLAGYNISRDHNLIAAKRKVIIYHYPYSIEDQRINSGFIFSATQDHTIPTLGGLSGAVMEL